MASVEVGAEYEEKIYRGGRCFGITRIYKDRLSDRRVLRMNSWRRQAMTMGGMVLEVEAKVVGANMVFSVCDPKEEGTPVVDVVCEARLLALPRVSETVLRQLLVAYSIRLTRVLEAAGEKHKAEELTANFGEFVEFAVKNMDDIDLYVTDGRKGSLVFVHFKNGRYEDPTVLYLAHGLKAEEYEFHLRGFDKAESLEEDMDDISSSEDPSADASSQEDMDHTTPSAAESSEEDMDSTIPSMKRRGEDLVSPIPSKKRDV